MDRSFAEQYRTLLEVSQSIASHRDLGALFHDLAQRLHGVVEFDYLNLLLHDPDRNVMRLHVLESSEPSRLRIGTELPIDESPGGHVWKTQQPLVVDDVDNETRFPLVTQTLQQHGVHSFCTLPLTTAQRRVGAMGLGSVKPAAYSHADLEFLEQVAKQVALAVDNALHHEEAERERDRLRALLDVNNALVSSLEFRDVFSRISAALRQVIQYEYASLAIHEPESDSLRLQALDFPAGKGVIREQMLVPVAGSPAGEAFQRREPLIVRRGDAGRFPSEVVQALLAEGLQSGCCVPLVTRNRVIGTLNVATTREDAFSAADLELLAQVASQIAIAVENALAYQQIAQLKDKLAEEKLYLEGEIRTEFEEIVGQSPAWRRILKEVETVAPTDATVLILGETGTGKELIARAIHNLSTRRERTFVKLNCAAIPTGLLESELFGHEKGAFTGAIAKKIGRLELAEKGTLFLDEVGDIPLEIQPKLLRALQEREFERLGSTATIRVDVRLIAATNRDLTHMVAEREFRADLFYRLNVFPIAAPPLRERPEDIPLLVRYFAEKISRRMNKPIETIPGDAMEALARYHWPGNVRELENLIERAVILSRGPALHVPLGELKKAPETDGGSLATLAQAEREHILRALRESHWVIGGPHGAAARLGMKRTTLQSKMRKLDIAKTASA